MEIPEVTDDPALAEFLRSTNDSSTAFLTVGCASGGEESEHGHTFRGYVEICFNYREIASEPTEYFGLFWQFSHLLRQTRFAEQVWISWELEQASFFEKGFEGFTCVIKINTGPRPDSASAYDAWSKTLLMHSKILGQPFECQLLPVY